jgi:hypothetical protein
MCDEMPALQVSLTFMMSDVARPFPLHCGTSADEVVRAAPTIFREMLEETIGPEASKPKAAAHRSLSEGWI